VFGGTALGTAAALVAGLVTAAPASAAASAHVSAHAPKAATSSTVPVHPVLRHAVAVPKMSDAAAPAGAAPTLAASAVTVRGSATAQIAPQATVKSLGVRGAVLSLAGTGTGVGSGSAAGAAVAGGSAAGAAVAGKAATVRVTVSYAGIANAYGADYGSRLRLAELPACALTTPSVPACQAQKPLAATNNARSQSVAATVALAAGGQRTVLALVSGPSGSGGNYAAEPVSEATDAWVGGASAGAFTYTYPFTLPPVPGGLEPPLNLEYNSLATSGLDASTNNEASWAGDGWELNPGYVERDFAACTSTPSNPQTNDLCGGRTETVLSIGGVTTPLVDGSGGWRAAADSGAQVIQSGSSWEVIEPNGYQYYYGLNTLSGYAAGDATTNSRFTVPVWQGCGTAAFCNQSWRDMLDYVVDPHGNAIAYFYNDETNAYSELDGTTADGSYTTGGYLTSIAYGFRAGQYYTSTPDALVDFTSSATRQDAPTDLECTAGSACAQTAPSFWTDRQLTGVSTSVLVGGSQQKVDSWSLTGSYPATGDSSTAPSLWLSSIQRTGQDGAAAVTLPPVTFAGTPLPNRVMTAADTAAGDSAISRFYLSSVTNESGGVVSVGYSAPSAATSFPSPSANGTADYPDYWLQQGTTTPVLDWFEVYAADTVTKHDTTGGDPDAVTTTTYAGPAWAYDADTVSRSATVTWDQFRGYKTVTTETGSAPDPQTEQVATYLQGLSQDGPPGAPGPVVTDTTTRGQQITDLQQFAGVLLEQMAYDGAGSAAVVTDSVDIPWTSAATAVNSQLDQDAFLTGTNASLVYTPLAGGSTRESTESFTYTSDGLQASDSKVPDTANSAESTCTVTTYAADTTSGLIDLPETKTTDTGVCTGGGGLNGSLVAEDEYFYDGGTLGAAPSAGNVTKAGKAVGGGLIPVFDFSTATFDEYGRALTTADPDGHTTTLVYTPSTGAEPTSVKSTDPMGLATSTTYDPARDLPLTVTDPTGGQTVTAYDALGRPTAKWTPGNPTFGPPVLTYAYAVGGTVPTVTTVETEQPGGGYLAQTTISDSWGRQREVQQGNANGGSEVTDTVYDSAGRKSLVSNPYAVASAPSTTLVAAASANVPSQIGTVYDGAGRVIRQISYAYGTESFETDTAYGGDYTTLTPPAGGTASTTFTDGRGLTTAIYQYHAGAPLDPTDPVADYDKTTYTYTPGKYLASIDDSAGDAWTYTYDLLGHQLTGIDPDTGKTVDVYDPAGQLTTSTDARGKAVSYTYDADGRKTAQYDTTGGAAETMANELDSWLYDTLAKGKPTSSTSYSGGAAYTEEATGYNTYELPTGNSVVIPSTQGALAGTYTEQYTYAPDGDVLTTTDQAVGGLPAETIATGYNSAGEPDSLVGASTYVQSLSYTGIGSPSQYQLGTSSEPVYVTDSYDPETNQLAEQNTETGASATSVDDLNYTYNDIGSVTSEADTPSGATGADETQCFQYDYLGRLVLAWTQAVAGCPSTAPSSPQGGAAPYQEAYQYNAIGDLTEETSTSTSGQSSSSVETYPAAGAAQPHALATDTVSGSGAAVSTSYGHDASGDLTSVSNTAQNESLTWTDAGQLGQITTTPSSGAVQNAGYVYDAGGALLVRSDTANNSVTLILGDEELDLDTANGQVTGTRYYTLGTDVVASRSGATGYDYLVGDTQGTDSVQIDAATLDVTRRYFDPYGNPIGTAPAGWAAGQKGFVGGTADASTGLTDLGAREYNPVTGSFISADSVLNPYDPQDLNAYAYASDNPASESDPSGKAPLNAYGCEGSTSSCVTPAEMAIVADAAADLRVDAAAMADSCAPVYKKCPQCPVVVLNCASPPSLTLSSTTGFNYETAFGDLNFSTTVSAVTPGSSIAGFSCNLQGACTAKIKAPDGVVSTVKLPTQALISGGANGVNGLRTASAPSKFSSLWTVLGTKTVKVGPFPITTTITADSVSVSTSATLTAGSGRNKVTFSFSASATFTLNAPGFPTAPAPLVKFLAQVAGAAGIAAVLAGIGAFASWVGRQFSQDCPDAECIPGG
jgi:RHS repeat-associated protein